mgnify:CR=1 FL=1
MEMKDFIRLLEISFSVMGKLMEEPSRKLNLDRLTDLIRELPEYSGVSVGQIRHLISVVLQHQDMFKAQEEKFRYSKEPGVSYLFLDGNGKSKPKQGKSENEKPLKVRLSKNEINQLSDIVQVHLHVNKGRGFDLESERNPRNVKKAKEMRERDPALFHEEGNKLYPGNELFQFTKRLSEYARARKHVSSIQVENVKFILS